MFLNLRQSDALTGYDVEKLEIIYRHEWIHQFSNLRLVRDTYKCIHAD